MDATDKPKRNKRPNGDGTYRQRPDGTWECRITLPNGKRKSFYGKTRDEVQAARKQADKDIDQGVDLSAKRRTVEQFLTEWLDSTAKPAVRPKTLHSYAQLVRLHIVPRIGKTRLDALTPQQVQRMMAEMTAAGLSPRTVQYARAILRRALGYALKWGLVSRNVATLVDPPRSVKKDAKWLSAPEAFRFLNHASTAEPTLWPLMTTALLTGLRQGELLGLRWRNVDLDRGTLRVTHALQRIDGNWQFVEPKSSRSARTLALPPRVVAALRVQRDRQAFEQRAAGESWAGLDLVFATPKGTPLEPSNLNGRLHQLLDGCGLPRLGMHALRHSCASLLVAQGISPRVVMEQLGHSQISLTMDTYSHVMPTMLADAAKALEAALDGVQTG